MPAKDNIRKMFDNISGDYDSLNHLMSLNIDRGWRRRTLRWILDAPQDLDRPWQVLDIACGTGDFSIAAAKAMKGKGMSGHVTGADISEGMLGVMRGKVAAEGLEDMVSVETGDCEDLAYADNSFDRVTVAFGVRNFEKKETALREVLRVLRPGGRFVMLELSLPGNPILRWLYNSYFFAVSKLGGLISGNKASYRYLPESVVRFPGPKHWIPFMESCGFRCVSERALTLGICRMYTGEK